MAETERRQIHRKEAFGQAGERKAVEEDQGHRCWRQEGSQVVRILAVDTVEESPPSQETVFAPLGNAPAVLAGRSV